MVIVAVPGGTGGVGRTIVEAVNATNTHKAIGLSRKAPETQDPNCPLLEVDYTDIDALVKVLQDNNIEVVISAIFIGGKESGETELNIVKAAEKSKTTQRFIISNWGIPIPPKELQLPQQEARLTVMNEISKTTLEWTQFYNGFFLDYYGMPYIESHLSQFFFVVDIEKKIAAIPGSGDEPFSLTYSKDLGKFVAAVLDVPKWEESYCVCSETTTWNSVVKRAEAVRGSKFKVTYDDTEKLWRGESTELPSHGPESYIPLDVARMLQARFGLYTIHGLSTVDKDKALNKKFPEIKTTTVDEVLGLWEGK